VSNPKNDINFLRAKIKRLESLLNKKDTPTEQTLNDVSGTLKNLKDLIDPLDLQKKISDYDIDFSDLKGFRTGIDNGTNIPTGLSGKFADKNLFDGVKDDFTKIKTGDLSIATGLKGILDEKTPLTDFNKIKTGDLTDAVGLKGVLDAKAPVADLVKIKSGDLTDATGLKGLLDSKTAITDFNKLKDGDLEALGANGLKGILDGKASNAAVNSKANTTDVYTRTQVDGFVSAKANTTDVYTKTQVDTSLGLKANASNVYTKTETDTALGLKANSANVYNKTEANNTFTTAAQVNSAIGGFDFSAAGNNSINTRFTTVNTTLGQKANSANVYTKTETDTALGLKANSANVYTKTQVDGFVSSKANTADVYTRTDANNTFRTSAQVNSAIGAFDFSSAGNPSFNNRLLGTENKVGSIGLTANAGSANSGFGGFFAVAGSQNWNYLGGNAKFTIALTSASLAANAGNDIPQFSLALERNAYYLNNFFQGRTETDVQKFITYDLDMGDSRGDLTLNAGNVFIKGDDTFGNHLTHFTHNRGSLVGGSDNGGAIYFGISAGDSSGGTIPTAGIETSWNNASSPRIGIGVIRDGNKASIIMDYSSIITFKTNNTSRFYVNSNGDVNPNTSNNISLGTSGQIWKAVYVAGGVLNGSDERTKKDIEDSDLGLEFINALRPVKYKFKVRENKIEVTSDGEETVTQLPGIRPHYGFIAQEVKKVLGNKDFAGYAHDPETDYYGLRYTEFISPMVKAIQELSKENDYLKKKLEEKDKQLENILLRLSALESK